MLNKAEECSHEYAKVFEESGFAKLFARDEYENPKTADYIQMRLAASWTDRCDKTENVHVGNKNNS